MLAALGCAPGSERPQIGLITKADANPYFVALRERARSRADAAGVTLLTATGQRDGDNASRVSALETMVAKGAPRHPDHPQ